MHRVDSVIRDSGLQARPYQRRVCSKAVDKFRGEYIHEQTGERERAVKSIMIESPTGSGKTCMAMILAKALQIDDPDLTIGWVAIRRNLLGQAARENRDKNINLNNAHFISMFDKNPQELIQAKRQGKRVLFVVDECLAGETLVHTLVNEKESLVPISEIVENGVGTHVLSYNHESDCLEWMEISTRACTGAREVFEVEIETDDGRIIIITATANHRFLTTNQEYRRLDELVEGAEVFVKHNDEEHVCTQETQHDDKKPDPV